MENSHPPDRSQTAVVAAIIADGDRYLVAKRAASSSLAGYWEFPGGKVEPGESSEDALCREIQEEMGVSITVLSSIPFATVDWKYDHAQVHLVALRAAISAGEPRPLDHEELRWLTPHEILELNLLPADRPVAARLQERTELRRG
jgi:8-oxo-dGTP diphosphatase